MKTIITLLSLFALAGTAIAEPQPGAPSGNPAAASQYPNQGKVLETMDASIYTYIQVSTDKAPVWLAVSKIKVAKGDTIRYPSGAPMTNFHSKSLNRTFETIIFLDKIEVVKK
ncbi:MAG: hypothetical protein A2V79_03430 [Betaproteobacteria bacterium RBG_16_56_24]|nr:MAG: hypothetical protein A2V79_03430 [Betaproteobacteria bacterium RBG_16_56_24]